jgi:hypothetical protein
VEGDDGQKTVTVPATTAPAELGITQNSSFYASSASAEAAEALTKAMNWALNKGGAISAATAAGVVNALNFEDETETPAEQAYLLNCPVMATPEDTQAYIDQTVAPQFKFTTISFVDGKPVYNVSDSWTDSENVYEFNGKPAFQGATTLGQWFDVDADGMIPGEGEGPKVLPSFFKAVLTK